MPVSKSRTAPSLPGSVQPNTNETRQNSNGPVRRARAVHAAVLASSSTTPNKVRPPSGNLVKGGPTSIRLGLKGPAPQGGVRVSASNSRPTSSGGSRPTTSEGKRMRPGDYIKMVNTNVKAKQLDHARLVQQALEKAAEEERQRLEMQKEMQATLDSEKRLTIEQNSLSGQNQSAVFDAPMPAAASPAAADERDSQTVLPKTVEVISSSNTQQLSPASSPHECSSDVLIDDKSDSDAQKVSKIDNENGSKIDIDQFTQEDQANLPDESNFPSKCEAIPIENDDSESASWASDSENEDEGLQPEFKSPNKNFSRSPDGITNQIHSEGLQASPASQLNHAVLDSWVKQQAQAQMLRRQCVETSKASVDGASSLAGASQGLSEPVFNSNWSNPADLSSVDSSSRPGTAPAGQGTGMAPSKARMIIAKKVYDPARIPKKACLKGHVSYQASSSLMEPSRRSSACTIPIPASDEDMFSSDEELSLCEQKWRAKLSLSRPGSPELPWNSAQS